MAMSEASEVIIKAAAVIVAIGILYRFGLAAYRTARRVEDTFDLVHHELTPNSGSSLYDAIKRIDKRVEVLEALDRRDLPRRVQDTNATIGEDPT
jgi:hypothetical protein